MVGRHEVPIDSDSHPLRQLARELRELRAGAGSPTYRAMARDTGCGASTLSQAASGERLPSAATLRAYVTACGGDVEAWEARRQEVAELQAAAVTPYGPSVAPYRGLARYEPGDSGVYFGRGDLVAQLLGVVREHRLTALVGPSGSGKSSLLRAGLIPALRAEPARVRPAAIRVFTPGLRPADLKAALTRARKAAEGAGADRAGGHGGRGGDGGDGGDTVVIVDQFEELFCRGVRAEQRAEYARMVLGALEEHTEGGGRLRLVIGVRADSFPLCAEHPGLARALRDSTVHVPPMDPAELREVVVKPAAAAGLIVERSLTARILREAGREPGCLPLVSHALLETWQRRRGRTLTEEMYEAAGGIHGAIATTAEELYGRLSSSEAPAARRVLLRLVTPGEDGAHDTVRLADRAEFGHGGRSAHTALEALVTARLVTMDGDTVALAHEAMIAAWPRLSGWIDEERDRLRLHRRLTEAAATWRALGDDPEALYRGGRLAAAEAAFPGRARALELTATEREFLVAGGLARDREVQAASRLARRVRVLSLSLALVVALALTVGITAVYWSKESGRQRRDAVEARQRAATAQRVAGSQQLAGQANALSGTYPDLAALLAVSAYRTYPTDAALGSLQRAAAQPLRRRLTQPLPGARVTRLAFSPDGTSLAAGGASGVVGVWDMGTGRLRTVRDQGAAPAAAVAFTPDSAGLLVDRAGGVDTYRTATTAPAGSHVNEPAAALTVLSADGRTQASAGGHGPVTVRDAVTGRTRVTVPVAYHVTALAVSADGAVVATAGGGEVTVRDAHSGQVLATIADQDDVVALALDGTGHTVLAQGRRQVRIWDVRTGHEWRHVSSDGADGLPLTAPALSPDGRIAAGGAGHTAWEWDVRAGAIRATLTGHAADITAVSFAADGSSVATGDAAGEVRVWDVPRRAEETACSGDCDASAVSADGRVAVLAEGGQAQVYEVGSGGGSRTVPGTGGGNATALALDARGGTLAVAGPGGRLRLVDLATGRTRSLPSAGGTVSQLRFSPEGRTLAALVGDRTVRTWDVATGTSRSSSAPAGSAKPHSLAFSPDGRTLAAGDAAGGVRLWDAATLRTAAPLNAPEPGGVQELDSAGLAFSPDGRHLAAGTAGGDVLVWDLATGRPKVLTTGRLAAVSALAYSSGSDTLAAGFPDGTVQLWDPATGGIRETLVGTGGQGMWLSFASQARGASGAGALFTGGRGVPLGRWQPELPDAAGAVDLVCTAVGRELTPRERGVYLTEGASRSGCAAPPAVSGAEAGTALPGHPGGTSGSPAAVRLPNGQALTAPSPNSPPSARTPG